MRITSYKQRLNGRDRDDSGAFISKRTTLTKLPVTLCGESVSSIMRSLSIVFRLHFAKVKGRSDLFFSNAAVNLYIDERPFAVTVVHLTG